MCVSSEEIKMLLLFGPREIARVIDPNIICYPYREKGFLDSESVAFRLGNTHTHTTYTHIAHTHVLSSNFFLVYHIWLFRGVTAARCLWDNALTRSVCVCLNLARNPRSTSAQYVSVSKSESDWHKEREKAWQQEHFKMGPQLAKKFN